MKTATPDTHRELTPGLYEVTSGTSGSVYAVRPVEGLCQCAGWHYRRSCRHLEGVRALLAAKVKTAEVTARGGQCAPAPLTSRRTASAIRERLLYGTMSYLG
jgi:hypothetical protein